jgi:hydrogenase-4 component B
MLDLIATSPSFIVLVAIFAFGAAGAFLGRRSDGFANWWGNLLAALGSIWGLVFASSVLISGNDVVVRGVMSDFPLLSLSFHIDRLSAFFIGVICLVALFCSIYAVDYIKDYYRRYSIGGLTFFFNMFIGAMLLVVAASNAIVFLIAWEAMSLASYFLVTYDRNDNNNVKAGYTYLVMTQVGTMFILLAFMVLYGYTQSFDFAAIKGGVSIMPQLARDLVFGLAFIGFGTKAGVIPVHIWLPTAHPAAPSHVSALMSGVMIKMGIYMMVRMFLDILQPAPTWWGVVVLVVGSVSCVLGVLYALTEHDIKRLLAYHSIENIGIILLGLGGAMVFASLHQNGLMLLSLAAALFHTLNHAIFKSLLFLAAGSVIHSTHTRNIEKYGGLIRFMPMTALFFLVGSMAISALPPFNGFFSEWFTFQSLFHGAMSSDLYVKWAFLIAIGALALTGGLAVACFVKAFGTTSLARPRSEAVLHAKDASWGMRIGMAGLVALCLALGLLAAPVITVLQSIVAQFTNVHVASLTAVSAVQVLTVGRGYASVWSPGIFALVALVPVLVWLVVRYGVNRRQKVRTDLTWDCGTDMTGRMEITSTGFARSIVSIFKGVLKPTMQHDLEYDDAASRYAPKSRLVTLHVADVYQKYSYGPLYDAAVRTSRLVKRIQSGNVNAYVLYIFVVLVITLLVGV